MADGEQTVADVLADLKAMKKELKVSLQWLKRLKKERQNKMICLFSFSCHRFPSPVYIPVLRTSNRIRL